MTIPVYPSPDPAAPGRSLHTDDPLAHPAPAPGQYTDSYSFLPRDEPYEHIIAILGQEAAFFKPPNLRRLQPSCRLAVCRTTP